MKNASRILYIVGIVINILGILFTVIGLIIFAIAAFNQDVISQVAHDIARPDSLVKNLCLAAFIVSLIELVVQGLVLAIAFRAIRNLKKDNGNIASHVMLIVLGVVGFDLFYFLGGIFGVAAANEVREAR